MRRRVPCTDEAQMPATNALCTGDARNPMRRRVPCTDEAQYHERGARAGDAGIRAPARGQTAKLTTNVRRSCAATLGTPCDVDVPCTDEARPLANVRRSCAGARNSRRRRRPVHRDEARPLANVRAPRGRRWNSTALGGAHARKALGTAPLGSADARKRSETPPSRPIDRPSVPSPPRVAHPREAVGSPRGHDVPARRVRCATSVTTARPRSASRARYRAPGGGYPSFLIRRRRRPV